MPLPNFLIAGAAKCGTTSLAAYLAEHPQVFVAPDKEIDFFERDYVFARGVDWYAEQFAAAGDAIAVGEGTPNYMFYPWAVERIADILPAVRFVICLRDPVDRAYSHYLHWREGFGWEPRSFERAMADELAMGGEEVDEQTIDGDPPYFAYLARGLYARQLKRLEERFGRDRIHVVLLEDLKARPEATFAAVCRFLGVDDGFVPPNIGVRENVFQRHRAAWAFRALQRRRLLARMPQPLARFISLRLLRPRPHTPRPVDPAVRARLGAHFAPHNAELEGWLGRDLSSWT